MLASEPGQAVASNDTSAPQMLNTTGQSVAGNGAGMT